MTERYLAKWYAITMAVVVASAIIGITLVRGQSTVETFNVVERRSSRDVYVTMNMSITCHSEETYLVFEGRCVSNEELTTGCSFEVTPSEELLTLFMSHPINGTLYETAQTQNSSRSNILVDALIRSKESNQTVSSPDCTISSLEVYRGRQQAIAIDKRVFTLSDSGTIKITTATIEPYEGELYRMNLSCSDNDLPQNGCLFFKVQGKTNLTKAKFNCLVPGTNETTMDCINRRNSRVTDGNTVDSTSHSSSNGAGENSGPSDVTLDIITYTILVAAVCLSLLFVVALTMTVLYSKFSQQSETEQTEQSQLSKQK